MGMNHDVIERKIKLKRKIAENAFKLMYESDKGKEEKTAVLNTVLEQIEVCEGLCVPVEVETIIDWLRNKSVHEIERAARKLKFAS